TKRRSTLQRQTPRCTKDVVNNHVNASRHWSGGSMTHNRFDNRHCRRFAVQELTVPGIEPKPKRAKQRNFIVTTKAQSDRLDLAKHFATERVFRQLQFLSFKAWGQTFRLANTALVKRGISRKAKRAALAELEKLGLIH